jgi:hypothetical protein
MYVFIVILILLFMLAKKENMTILPNNPWDYSNIYNPDTLYYLENDGRKGNLYNNVIEQNYAPLRPAQSLQNQDNFYNILNKLGIY